MVSLLTHFDAQRRLADTIRSRRIAQGLTQSDLAQRAGVPLATVRKFEQKRLISRKSFLKLLILVGLLDAPSARKR